MLELFLHSQWLSGEEINFSVNIKRFQQQQHPRRITPLLLFVIKDHIAVKAHSLPFIYRLPLPLCHAMYAAFLFLSIINNMERKKDQPKARLSVLYPLRCWY